jgi:hypothetical protein
LTLLVPTDNAVSKPFVVILAILLFVILQGLEAAGANEADKLEFAPLQIVKLPLITGSAFMVADILIDCATALVAVAEIEPEIVPLAAAVVLMYTVVALTTVPVLLKVNELANPEVDDVEISNPLEAVNVMAELIFVPLIFIDCVAEEVPAHAEKGVKLAVAIMVGV